jgi:hypothetical protein
MKDIIEEDPYTVEKRSPLNKITVQVTKTLEHIKEKYDVNLLHLRSSNISMPKLYGLPKIHKPENKMRPISSNNNAPTERIAKWLNIKF